MGGVNGAEARKALYALQEKDREIDRLRAEAESLPEELVALQGQVETLEERLTNLLERRAELERISALFEQSAIGETLLLFERAHEAERHCAQRKTEYEALYAEHGAL